MVPGQDLVGPGDDGVDDVVVFGQFAGLVEVTEPVECFKRAVVVLSKVSLRGIVGCGVVEGP